MIDSVARVGKFLLEFLQVFLREVKIVSGGFRIVKPAAVHGDVDGCCMCDLSNGRVTSCRYPKLIMNWKLQINQQFFRALALLVG